MMLSRRNTRRSIQLGRQITGFVRESVFDPERAAPEEFRIKVPDNISMVPQTTSQAQARSGNRLANLLLRAMYTIVYRVRADNRIQKMKDYFGIFF